MAVWERLARICTHFFLLYAFLPVITRPPATKLRRNCHPANIKIMTPPPSHLIPSPSSFSIQVPSQLNLRSPHSSPVTSLCVDSTSRYLLSGDRMGMVGLWDLQKAPPSTRRNPNVPLSATQAYEDDVRRRNLSQQRVPLTTSRRVAPFPMSSITSTSWFSGEKWTRRKATTSYCVVV